ncbi:MAG: stalk domain-containing protein [Bacillota bacterium]
MQPTRPLLFLAVISLCLALFPAPALAEQQAANGSPGFIPARDFTASTGWLDGEYVYLSTTDGQLETYDLATLTLLDRLPLDAPLCSLTKVAESQLLGVTATGILYAFELKDEVPSIRYVRRLGTESPGSAPLQLAPDTVTFISGDTATTRSLATGLEVGQTEIPGLVGRQYAQVAAGRLVLFRQSLEATTTELLVYAPQGEEELTVVPGVSLVQPAFWAEQELLYFVAADREVKQLHLASGEVSSVLATEEDIERLTLVEDGLLVHQGGRLALMDLQSGRIVHEFAAPAAGPSYPSATGRFWHVNPRGINLWGDNELAWGAEFAGDETAALLADSAGHLLVRVHQQALRLFQATDNRLAHLALQPGQSLLLRYQQVEFGPLSWSCVVHNRDTQLQLSLGVFHRSEPEAELAQLATQSCELTATSYLEGISPGEILILLSPMPVAEAGQHPSHAGQIRFSIAVGPHLLPNTERPPRLRPLRPQIGTELWGETAVLFELETDPLIPVHFGSSETPVFADESGQISQLMQLSPALVNTLTAYAETPGGHLAAATVNVINHWVLEQPQPAATLSRYPTISLNVPDASQVDTDASILQVGGVRVALTADLVNNRIVGSPDIALPSGDLSASLLLFGKSPASAPPLPLDLLQWQLPVVGARRAELWIGEQKAFINDAAVKLETPPYIDFTSSRAMVPFRFVGEVAGARVTWLGATRQARLELEDNVIELTIGSKTAYVNGTPRALDAAPTIINGRTMVPYRFLAENLGAQVHWDPAQSKVTVNVPAAAK